jgi:adapter protein MecA 1/2
MKIEKITENKIRIILNIDELAKKNIDFLSLTKNTDVAQKLFKKILKQAEKEVGFSVDNSKLLIEAFVSPEGFFIVTFTKIAPKKEAPANSPLKLKIRRKKSLASSSNNAVYEFSNFDDFCNFCTYLSNSKLGDLKEMAKNILLYEYNSKYFLVFSNINTDFKDISLFYSSIPEFAKHISNSSCFCSKLVEYGNVIFKSNAIKNGIKYFAKAE